MIGGHPPPDGVYKDGKPWEGNGYHSPRLGARVKELAADRRGCARMGWCAADGKTERGSGGNQVLERFDGASSPPNDFIRGC